MNCGCNSKVRIRASGRQALIAAARTAASVAMPGEQQKASAQLRALSAITRAQPSPCAALCGRFTNRDKELGDKGLGDKELDHDEALCARWFGKRNRCAGRRARASRGLRAAAAAAHCR